MNAPKWLRTRIDELFEQSKTPDIDDIKKVAMKGDMKLATKVSRMSKLKAYVKLKYGDRVDAEFLKELRAPSEDIEELLKIQTERRSKKGTFKFNGDDVDTILSWKDDNSPYKQLLYLQFISGRRISEMLESTFKPVKGKKYTLQSTELKKKKDVMNDRFDLIPEITSAEFNKRLRKVRDKLDGDSISDITHTVNRKIKKWWRPDASSHTMRGMYAAFTHDIFNNRELSINAWIKQALNHTSDDASLNYSRYIYEE